MLSVFIGILTVLIVIVSVLLILIVLMQRPKQEGLGAAFGGGMMDSLAGAHTTDVLQKGTVWLGTVFLSGAILLAVLKAKELQARDPGEVLPSVPAETALPGEAPSISDLPISPIPSSEPQVPEPAPTSEKTTPAEPTETKKGDSPASVPTSDSPPAENPVQ